MCGECRRRHPHGTYKNSIVRVLTFDVCVFIADDQLESMMQILLRGATGAEYMLPGLLSEKPESPNYTAVYYQPR